MPHKQGIGELVSEVVTVQYRKMPVRKIVGVSETSDKSQINLAI